MEEYKNRIRELRYEPGNDYPDWIKKRLPGKIRRAGKELKKLEYLSENN